MIYLFTYLKLINCGKTVVAINACDLAAAGKNKQTKRIKYPVFWTSKNHSAVLKLKPQHVFHPLALHYSAEGLIYG